MNDFDIMVSIIVPTYGHERYIAKALDGILMQKTKYRFEVLVGEDASPDDTRRILQEYEAKYPGFFQMFYREHNMTQDPTSVGNYNDLRYRTRGKYIMCLEGDDYWTDPCKLEKQVDFLESHPDYIAVGHWCTVVDENNVPTGEQYPECLDEEYTLRHYLQSVFPGQLATIMHRNFWLNHGNAGLDISILQKNLMPGDRVLYFFLATHGRVGCILERMTAYRHVTQGGYSYSANYRGSYEKTERWNLELLGYARSTRSRRAAACAEAVFFSSAFSALVHREISLKRFLTAMKSIRRPLRAFALYVWKCGARVIYLYRRAKREHVGEKGTV